MSSVNHNPEAGHQLSERFFGNNEVGRNNGNENKKSDIIFMCLSVSIVFLFL